MPTSDDKRPDGLTPDERVVSDHLIAAWGAWVNLPRKHPNELGEFCQHIHQLQGLLALRALQRLFPEIWPTYEDDEHE